MSTISHIPTIYPFATRIYAYKPCFNMPLNAPWRYHYILSFSVTYLLLSLFCTIPLFEFSFVLVWRTGLDGPRASVHVQRCRKDVWRIYTIFYMFFLSFWVIFTFWDFSSHVCNCFWTCGAWYLSAYTIFSELRCC
jgi:hypothetical protein